MELLYFIIASFLVVIVPGPTVSLIIANSLRISTNPLIVFKESTQLLNEP